jgi:hypothetical protein
LSRRVNQHRETHLRDYDAAAIMLTPRRQILTLIVAGFSSRSPRDN